MKQTVETKKLLNCNKHILQNLHNVFCVDFEKETTIIREIQLPKTINAILKENSDIINSKTTNLLLFDDEWGDTSQKRCVQIGYTGTIKIDVNCKWQAGLSNFYRKADVETARKKEGTCFLVVFSNADKTSLTSEKQEEKLVNEYFNNPNMRLRKYNTQSNYRLLQLYNVNFDNSNISCHVNYGRFPHRYDEEQTYENCIDKSGYNVYVKKHNLEMQILTMKENNNKNAIKHADFTKDNQEIRNELYKLKDLIIKNLSDLTIADSKKLYNYSNLMRWDYCNIVENYNRHLDKLRAIKNNDETGYYTYKDVDSVNTAINFIKKDITEINQKLQELNK